MPRLRGHGLTLLELIITLAVLTMVLTLAVSTVSTWDDQERFEATRDVLARVEGAIVGQGDGASVSCSFLADIGRRPGSLAELLDAPALLASAPYALHAESGLSCGWRGPYLRLFEDTLRDGFGAPFVEHVLGGEVVEVEAGMPAGSAFVASLSIDLSDAQVFGDVRVEVANLTSGAIGVNVRLFEPVDGVIPADAAAAASFFWPGPTAAQTQNVAAGAETFALFPGVSPGLRALRLTRVPPAPPPAEVRSVRVLARGVHVVRFEMR